MKNLINVSYWRACRPIMVNTSADYYYVNLWRKIYQNILSTEIGRASSDVWAFNASWMIASYFEDVVSQLGFWNVFVSKHKELYGKYLPFYDIEESDYMLDDVNMYDISLLLWMSVQQNKEGALVNPENVYLLGLARQLHKLLYGEFEKAPINQDLLSALKNKVANGDFKSIESLGVCMINTGYLFSNFAKLTRERVEQDVNIHNLSSVNQAIRTEMVDFVQAFCRKVSPLPIDTADWLAGLFDLWGLKEESRKMSELQVREPDYYLLKSCQEEDVLLEDVDGNTYQVAYEAFQPMLKQLIKTNQVCNTSLVCFDGRWTTGESVSWYPSVELFERVRALRKEISTQNESVYQKVLKANNNRPIVYFKDWKEFVEWSEKNIGTDNRISKSSSAKNDLKYLVLFASVEEGMVLVPDAARLLKDEGSNPYYDANLARRAALHVLLSGRYVSKTLLHYVLDNNMLSDIAVNSIADTEKGKKLLHDNMEFVIHFMRVLDY